MMKVSVLRSPEIHDWERFVIVSDGVTTICEICDSREVRKLASRLERELLKARRERMTEKSCGRKLGFFKGCFSGKKA